MSRPARQRVYKIAVLGGEGVGPEVTDAACTILKVAAQRHDLSFEFRPAAFGLPAVSRYGSAFPTETVAVCTDSDAILLGAVEKGGLLELRRHFDFFANLRPVRAWDELLGASSLKPEALRGLDVLFVRELSSGLHFGPAERGRDELGEFGVHTMLYYDSQVRRIARVALQKARERGGRLTLAHKENALPNIPWRSITQEEAVDFPEVEIEELLVDTLSMRLAIEPTHFDVVLAENMMGDWLSSLGAGLVGTIGLLGSASLNPRGFGLFEPIHGTAPDLAGRDLANPIGAILSAAMMLENFGEVEAAASVREAVDRVLAAGWRTPDMAEEGASNVVGTQELTAAIAKALAPA